MLAATKSWIELRGTSIGLQVYSWFAMRRQDLPIFRPRLLLKTLASRFLVVNHESRLIRRAIVGQSPSVFYLVYENEFSPPTYGEILQVAMLARFMALSGLRVEFLLVDGTDRRSDWSFLTPEEQQAFVLEQKELVHALLPTGAILRCLSSLEFETSNLATPGNHVLLARRVRKKIGIYPHVPRILDRLARNFGDACPEGFLLDKSEFVSDHPDWLDERPYIVWNVRVGVWDRARNPSLESVIQDFRDLRLLFPSHRIAIFSTPSGIESTLGHLIASGELCLSDLNSQRVFSQPDTGFLATIPWVLRSDFYFQRLGGGLSLVPAYSRNPYLTLIEWTSYWTGFRGKRIVSWAKSDQITFVLPGLAKSIRIRRAFPRREFKK